MIQRSVITRVEMRAGGGAPANGRGAQGCGGRYGRRGYAWRGERHLALGLPTMDHWLEQVTIGQGESVKAGGDREEKGNGKPEKGERKKEQEGEHSRRGLAQRAGNH